MKRKIVGIVIALLITAFLLTSCSGNVSDGLYDMYFDYIVTPIANVFAHIIDEITPPPTEKYADYEVVDLNLLWLRAEDDLGYNTLMRYKKLSGIDENEMVGAWEKAFLGTTSEPVILGNPESVPDIWREWEIESVGIYISDIPVEYNDVNSREDAPEDIFVKENISVTYNSDVISVARYIASQEVLDSQRPGSGFVIKRKTPHIYYYLRIAFSKSPDLVWEAEVCIYESETDNSEKKVIVYKKNKETANIDFVEVPADSELYLFVLESIDE